MKRPSGAVGIKIVDSVVERSFNMYEQIFNYHLQINEGEILCEEDLLIINEIAFESEKIIKKAIDAKKILKKEKFIPRTMATIRLERAKRAVYYCQEASQEVLLAQNIGLKN
ncbi:hypothetical protein G3I01_07280 [Gramella sp. MT6]|uniref:hypothetical protein n=1 Tax=Gramella sp. MT6 TaxID=2705471 RepID=UPI001C5EA7C0|nr:hypothetical protein [Gramella sp. MT6]QYA25322.1 hypothetical protein G3I01_07280 [Gramella sp. MT6]